MKCLLILSTAVALASSAPAQSGEDQKKMRFLDRDADGDGRLSASELGEVSWNRVRGFDSDGDGALDAAEVKALMEKGKGGAGRGKGKAARPGGVNSAFEVREFQGSNGQSIRYSLFVPAARPESSPLPLVLCLHGAGGGTEAANRLAAPAMQARHPCVVMAPACEGESARWVQSEFRSRPDARVVMPELMEALAAVVAQTGADPGRLYLTGQSMGGVGTWGLIAAHPDLFAAAVPVCGIWKPGDAPKMKGVAIWAFHGEDDAAVPVSGSRDMIAALRRAGVKPEPKYTEFPGVGHGSWGPAYETPGLWDWLFAQSR